MFNPDLPITKASDDRLNRQLFAESLAHVLLQSSFPTSFAVGLYGPWGSGKTSLLNMVIEQVESETHETIIVRFNPWLCSDPKQLITQFFKQLASAIKIKKPAADKMCELVDQYADFFDAASALPYVGAAIGAGGKVVAKKARKRIDKRNNDLQTQKNEIIRKMEAGHLKIIVSIDDIDRLSETEIVAVFQLIKSLADFPNTVYLLAFDYDIVVRALETVQRGDGREYLEKVIQVPFEIPAPSISSIQDMLFTKLNEILGDITQNRWNKTAWTEMFQYGIRKYIESIRDVIRYSNVFSLKYELLKSETDPVDLLGLTCLQVFEPIVYSRLTHYKDFLCGQSSSYSYQQQNAEEEKITKAINEILTTETVANEEAAKSILGILFPKTCTALGHTYSFGRHYDYRSFLIHCNIAAPECFDRYFSLSLENDAIPTATVRRLIFEANESELLTGIDQIYQDGRIIRLLEEISAYANKDDSNRIFSARAALLMHCLCKKWSTFDVEEDGFFTIPFAWRLLFCVDPLLSSIKTEKRFPFLQEIFEDQEVAPSTLELLLEDFETQHGRFTDKEPIKDNQTLTLDELLVLESVFKNRCEEAINSGAALAQYGGLNFLWMLGHIDQGLVSRIKKKLVTDDTSLAKVISYCTSRGKTAVKLVVKTRKVDIQALSEFIDVAKAYQRMSTFITINAFLSLPNENQRDVMAFIIAQKRTSESRPTEGYVSEEEIDENLQATIHAIQAKEAI